MRSRAPRVGLLVYAESNVALLARVLERAGRWKCDLVGVESPPIEPPEWDVVLADVSTGLVPGRVAEHFGTSAPVVAVVGQSSDLLARWRELDGAEAFVYETVDPVELVAYVAKVMNAHGRSHLIRAGRVRIDLLRHVVSVGELSAELTSGEALVLGCLAHESGRWWHATELVDELRASHQTSDTIWQHIHRLRMKLGRWQAVLETSRSRGYRLNPCVKPAEDTPPGS